MTNEPYDRGLDILRDSEADEDFRTTSDVLSPDPTTGRGTGTNQYPDTGDGQRGLDDSQPTPVTSDQTPEGVALGSEGDDDLTGSAYDPADDLAGSPANAGGASGAQRWPPSAPLQRRKQPATPSRRPVTSPVRRRRRQAS